MESALWQRSLIKLYPLHINIKYNLFSMFVCCRRSTFISTHIFIFHEIHFIPHKPRELMNFILFSPFLFEYLLLSFFFYVHLILLMQFPQRKRNSSFFNFLFNTNKILEYKPEATHTLQYLYCTYWTWIIAYELRNSVLSGAWQIVVHATPYDKNEKYQWKKQTVELVLCVCLPIIVYGEAHVSPYSCWAAPKYCNCTFKTEKPTIHSTELHGYASSNFEGENFSDFLF